MEVVTVARSLYLDCSRFTVKNLVAKVLKKGSKQLPNYVSSWNKNFLVFLLLCGLIIETIIISGCRWSNILDSPIYTFSDS